MFYKTILAFLAAAVIISAQDTGSIPTCAQACVKSLLSTANCGAIDAACICKNTAFIDNISCCVSKDCDATGLANVITFANFICGAAGVSSLPQSPVCTGTATAAGASSTVTVNTASFSSSISAVVAAITSSAAAQSSSLASFSSVLSASGASVAASASAAASAVAASSAAAAATATRNVGARYGVGAGAGAIGAVVGAGVMLL